MTTEPALDDNAPALSRPALSQSDLAREWGVTRQAVQQWCKRGMPLTSVEEAYTWRLANTRMRRGSKIAAASTETNPAPGVVAKQLEGSERFVLDARNRARSSERLAYQLLAREGKRIQEGTGNEGALSVLRRDHTMALSAALKAEKDATGYLQSIKRLVSWDDVSDMIRRYVAPLQVGLESMPRLLAARVSPLDPGGAQEAMEEYIARMTKQLQQVHGFLKDYEAEIQAEVKRLEAEMMVTDAPGSADQ